MFAPMSAGGSDDVWHVQDEPASLKPGRFRAYLPNQLLNHHASGQAPSSIATSSRAIPFSRDANLVGRSAASKKRKGKARLLDDIGSGTETSDGGAANHGFGNRLAAGFGLGRNKRSKTTQALAQQRDQQRQQQHQQHPARPNRGIGRFGTGADGAVGSDLFEEWYGADYEQYPAQGVRQSAFGKTSGLEPAQRSLRPSPYQPSPSATPRTRTSRDGRPRPRSWVHNLVRPSRDTVEDWLDSWWKRWFALAVLPSLVVWFWCAVPFPKTDPYDPNLPWCNPGEDGRSDDPSNPPWCYPRNATVVPSSMSSAVGLLARLPTVSGLVYSAAPKLFAVLSGSSASASVSPSSSPAPAPSPEPEHLTVDANFWFFLVFYYGLYVAVALVYITQLFSLYRLNWWPAALGARTSYSFFWVGSLVAGWVLHEMDPFGTEKASRPPHELPTPSVDNGRYDVLRQHNGASNGTSPGPGGYPGGGGGSIDESDIQWQRKTLWVGLAFATMAMPALVCFVGLRRSGRQTYRHSLTDHQKTFLERQLSRRIPSSYIRFLWFISVIGLGLFALIAGQGYASVYLATLPHTGLDGIAYVSFWTLTVNGMALVSHWILEEKVRSRALLFVFKYYYFLVYFIFYRNLFARLRSFDQFALVQLLSSFWVCIYYPFSMSSICHRITQYFNPQPKSWEEYVESVGLAFYLRNLAQNTTMLAFLGWVSILHFGSNQQLYPFFAYDNKHDPYNYQLTMLGSLAIWGSELASSYVARLICYWAFEVDVTNLGLDEMREFPEVLTTIGWGAVHTLMDMLLFLIKLNFR
ncbi:uncharacterized protein PFL1_03845 [Pseudozyma flocculosa PF-1]|uniref:Uncharacterized protein n=2 Tax=Pseudozyma flocculosa TaxID=84751 RepID=A0A5C3EXG0_9BASI|nr:uncharacterized protein PFL1_03845 [Pseudozyma flocculosa PF-1]EPQ28541.1 hypothetical protein PFL1_03845 [Pseudozyma flocculosa PF-1]SPO36465.1 uncharacterized protein PSFLO_01936 [Pseudozyma flocculosa]